MSTIFYIGDIYYCFCMEPVFFTTNNTDIDFNVIEEEEN